MSYSMSFDASTKIKTGDARGWERHVARDVDRQHGCEVNHGNPMIDGSRTALNQTLVFQEGKGLVPAESAEQIQRALERRLTKVKKPLRKDAVVARGLILQLDPEFYKGTTDEERCESYECMLEWAMKTFPPENIICVSVHEDESNPHLHLMFTPVTDDGRLSQKDFFPNPAKLRQMHEDLRNHMRTAGYDIDLHNRKPGKHAKRMPETEYKDFAELKKAQAKLEARDTACLMRELSLDERAAQLDRKRKKLNTLQTELDQMREELNAQQAELDAERTALTERERKVTHLERVDKADKVASKVTETTRPHRKLPDIGFDL